MIARMTDTLVIDCHPLTPDPSTLAPAAPAADLTPWVWHRVKLLEGQLQTLHVERDEARAKVIDLEDEVAALRSEVRTLTKAAR
jgi:hypothetical protein